MMKLVYEVCFLLFFVVLSSDGLICGEVECPPQAVTCSLKYTIANKPRRRITTVNCFNPYQRNLLKKTYETILKEPLLPLPVVECGGYKCKPGAYNCTTVTTPTVNVKPPKETTHLTCRDDEGDIIEERDIVRHLSEPEASGDTPPTCEGHKCPKGSRSCTYDTLIQLEPYNKTTHVICFNLKHVKTSEVTLVL